jgi:hypothetical protein
MRDQGSKTVQSPYSESDCAPPSDPAHTHGPRRLPSETCVNLCDIEDPYGDGPNGDSWIDRMDYHVDVEDHVDVDVEDDDDGAMLAHKRQKTFATDLAQKGYAIVPSVLTPGEIAEVRDEFMYYQRFLQQKPPPHGIYQHAEAGHQRHAWLVRTNPRVQQVFKDLLSTNEIISSFDGYCYIQKSDARRDLSWTHTDQSPAKDQQACYQGFVSLTDNSERTFVAYEGSHLDHQQYFKDRDFTAATKNYSRDWHKIDSAYTVANRHNRKVLTVKAGDFVIWDSRTFHQNQYGAPKSEERFVQYISYMPRNCKANTPANQKKRAMYFGTRRTTSHWAAPIKVNGLQPQVYGDKTKLLDYSKLPQPILDDLNCLDLV